MTSMQNRQPAGIPTGGRFAHTSHAEPDVTLGPERPAGLDGWPESLPVPTFDLEWGEDGSQTTILNVDGAEIHVDYQDPYEGVIASRFKGHGHESWTEQEREEALAWAEEFHGQYEERIRHEVQKAAELARHRIAAEITGASAPISTASAWTVYNDSSDRAWRARRDAELAAASLLARKVRDRHPDAAYAELETDYDEEGEKYVSAIASYSADGEFLERLDYFGGLHTEEFDGPDGFADDGDSDVTDLMGYIDVDNVAPRLHHPRPDGEDHGYFIDLQKAVDWAPGAEGSH